MIAEKYINELVDFCSGLNIFPQRGSVRDDVLEGLRVIGFRKRTNIAFRVDVPNKAVSILGVFHGGQDVSSVLS